MGSIFDNFKEFIFDNENVYIYLGMLENDHNQQICIYDDFIELSIYLNDESIYDADVPGCFTIFTDKNKFEFHLEAVDDKLKLLRFRNFSGRIVYKLLYENNIHEPYLYIYADEKFDVDVVDEKDWIEMGCRITLNN